jgi:signal transduction histidine kinase
MKASKNTPGGEGAAARTDIAAEPHTEAELRLEIQRLQAAKVEIETTACDLRRSLELSSADSMSKSQYLATMSHELRTPLNAIIGFSEILKDEILGPIGTARYRDYAANIHKSGAYLLNLVNDLLDFSKIDAGKLDLIEETVDLVKIFGDCIQLMEPQARKAKVTLHAPPAAERFTLKADERRLRQIVLNLLSNAVKFTPEGGDVTLGASLSDDGLALIVADTGIGIAPEDIPRALERFGQIDSTLSRKYEGTGLGLPLAKHLAELHGARLAIDSEAGIGTTVTVTFPPSRIAAGREAAA